MRVELAVGIRLLFKEVQQVEQLLVVVAAEHRLVLAHLLAAALAYMGKVQVVQLLHQQQAQLEPQVIQVVMVVQVRTAVVATEPLLE
jgi:hypothetical protein